MTESDHTKSPSKVKKPDTSEVKDGRERGWFWLDNALVEEYLPKIGTYGMAIYSMLCFHAGKSGKAFPSLNTIAKKTKSSKPTVVKYLGILETLGLISIDHVTSDDGDHAHNVYTIKDLPGGKVRLPGSKADLPGVVNVLYQGGKPSLPEQESIEQDSSKQDSFRIREKELLAEIASLKAELAEIKAKLDKVSTIPSEPVLKERKKAPAKDPKPRPSDPIFEAISQGSFGLSGKATSGFIATLVNGSKKRGELGVVELEFGENKPTCEQASSYARDLLEAYEWHHKQIDRSTQQPLSPPTNALKIKNMVRRYRESPEYKNNHARLDENGADLNQWEPNPDIPGTYRERSAR